MRVREARGAFLAGGLLLAMLGAIPTTFAIARPELAGTVRDAVGSMLRDVEILVLRERGPDPIAVVRTGPDGRFMVPDLPLGTYRVVAVKDGYATWLGRVSVALRTTLDLVLQPAVLDPTMDPDWALRVPDRSLLRETDFESLLTADGSGGTTVARMDADRVVSGQLAHLFTFGADAVAGPREHLEGGDTRVFLSSHPGERAQVVFEARKRTLGASPGPLAAGRGRESSDLRLDVTYDTSLDGQLAVRAFYGSRDSELTPGSTAPRVLAYDATWSRQLRPTSRLTLDLAYLDTGLDPAFVADGFPMTGRALRAATGFDVRLGERHDVNLRLQARSADMSAMGMLLPVAGAAPGEIAILGGVPDPIGFGLRMDAQDSWRVSAPFTVVYGLGYEADVTGEQPGWFVQRAGVQWVEAEFRLDLGLSHHAAVAAQGGSAPSVADPFGWSAAVEFPLAPGLRLRGEAMASPGRDGHATGPVEGLVLERPAYLTDGTAQTRQGRVTVEHEARRTRTFVQVERGGAEGRLAVVKPADHTVAALEGQQLDFVAGRFGLRLVPTGTDVSAEYRRMLSSGPVDGESVELRIAQDLVRLQSRGAAWRLLLAARATQDGTAAAEGSGDGTEHWMGAGISLAF